MTSSHRKAPLRVFLIRGLAGGRPFYFSAGLDELARNLIASGVAASVHDQGSAFRPYGEVESVTKAALASARAGQRIVLVGHSMGADAALKVATILAAERITIPLIVCFDPTSFRLFWGPPPVPANVERALCFYQKISPLGRGILKAGPGFTGTLIQQQVATLHSGMDDDAQLRQRVLAELAQLAS